MLARTTVSTALAALLATTAAAEPIKIGMITTLSGGGAGLGIDVRDGFMLALAQAGDAASEIEVVVEDDQQKPEVAVQLADKMIQSDERGHPDRDHLLEPRHGGGAGGGRAGQVLPLAERRPVAARRAPAATRTTSTWPGRTTTCTRPPALTPTALATRTPSSSRRTTRPARTR